MMDNKELHELAAEIMYEPIVGAVPQNIAIELAAGVLRLGTQCGHQADVFEELLVNSCVLAELRDFWRKRYNGVANNTER